MERKIRVSIVEDQIIIRKGLRDLLNESHDFVCVADYSDAEQALEGIPHNVPDIVIMDIQLPGISGIACITRLKADFPEIQFVMFTIYENSEQVFEAIQAGASGYLLKSASNESILRSLHELYGGGAPMNARIAKKLVMAFRDGAQQPEGLVPDPNVYNISPRENEVLQLLSSGFLYKEIAERLHISVGTVKQHIHKIYDKLHVQNRTEALNKYFGRSGVV